MYKNDQNKGFWLRSWFLCDDNDLLCPRGHSGSGVVAHQRTLERVLDRFHTN